MSSSAISIASRIASPPTTVPGAESGAIPPILMGQSAAMAPVAKSAPAAVAVSNLKVVIDFSPVGSDPLSPGPRGQTIAACAEIPQIDNSYPAHRQE
ncbi:MAG: hypothetical protein M5U35_07730 [Roseovarius sp.]|nr:hypothetical protein [Roseovarius sp.]